MSLDLDATREKLVNRVFDSFKDNDEIKQVYQANGAKIFAEYMGDQEIFPNRIYNFTDVHEHYVKTYYGDLLGDVIPEHRAEIEIIDELEDRQARENFGKLVADKLVAYYEQ